MASRQGGRETAVLSEKPMGAGSVELHATGACFSFGMLQSGLRTHPTPTRGGHLNKN